MRKVISMFYELKDANSKELLESNFNHNEISFLTGSGEIIEALEAEVSKMGLGEEKTITISAKDGVGLYDENALQDIEREQFAGIELKVGMELFGEGESGTTSRVVVKEIGDKFVKVDFNHPYAGKDLEFFVKISAIRDATDDEIKAGCAIVPHSCGCGDECCGGHHHDEHECCGRHKHD